MYSIKIATEEDVQLLTQIGRQTFIESHGNSAPASVIDCYIKKNYSFEALSNEINNSNNIYHIISHNDKPAGFSKIILNTPHANIPQQEVTKLERLYILSEFYGLKIGEELFNFNLKLSKSHNQNGMWLFVWVENKRAIKFYTKKGFKIIGSYDFKLTDDHANPNHQMLLTY